jgi:hypothetical protein
MEGFGERAPKRVADIFVGTGKGESLLDRNREAARASGRGKDAIALFIQRRVFLLFSKTRRGRG